MSFASILNRDENIQFGEIDCTVLNAHTVNATVINGGGGGDSSNWSAYPASQSVDFGGNPIHNASAIGFNNVIGVRNVGSQLTIYDGTSTGVIYDSVFNPLPSSTAPTLRSVLLNGSNANGLGIGNVGSLVVSNINDCNTINVGTVTSVSTITGSSLAITGVSTINGSAYPPALAGATKTLTVLTSNVTQPVSIGSTYTVLWYSVNSSRSFGTSPFAFTAGEGIITNTSSNTLLVDVSCYFQWSASVQPNLQTFGYGSIIGDGTLFGLNIVNVPTSGTANSTNNVVFSAVLAPNATLSIRSSHTDTQNVINLTNAVLTLSATTVA
ncbi:MAG: hypothetical protein P4L79_05180 [Legionella sp.]|uniref:hypothetical protein n=1 Tax=Legionella sp. TaxID=459 RepID=UPI00284E594C|nr:hypothetical protein [Legionella sp.]